MDEDRFDQIAKDLSTVGTRRGVLRGLLMLPAAGALTAAVLEEAAARRRKGRRKRKRKKRGCRPESLADTCADRCGTVSNNCQQPVDCGSCNCDPPCPPCQTCDGAQCQECAVCCNDTCCVDTGAVCHAETGACCVPNPQEVTCAGRCGMVGDNCGAVVSCSSCPECRCDDQTGQCRPGPIVDKPCGKPGQVCQPNGACACDAGSCGACQRCGRVGLCERCIRCGGGVCLDR